MSIISAFLIGIGTGAFAAIIIGHALDVRAARQRSKLLTTYTRSKGRTRCL